MQKHLEYYVATNKFVRETVNLKHTVISAILKQIIHHRYPFENDNGRNIIENRVNIRFLVGIVEI